MKYYKNPKDNNVYGYDETDQTQIPFINQAIANQWTDITGSWPPAQPAPNLVDACKAQAMKLLLESDWTQLPDVALKNKTDFATYRLALRQLALNPVPNPVWPVMPAEQW